LRLRVGGVWSITFGPARNRLCRHRHVFEVIDRPRRLVLATTESRPDGSNFDCTIEFTFEPHDARTLLSGRQHRDLAWCAECLTTVEL
jgi:Activator of Hsp90 ATPase homolog 1-like protein